MATQLNYKHLRYFYAIAKEGSVVKAAKQLHVSPQTISGQLSAFENYLGVELFQREGKRLILNDAGRLAFGYAEDIFALGHELQQSLSAQDLMQTFVFSVGVTDVIPKILASSILEAGLRLDGPVKLICKEGEFDTLLSELALNQIDLIISDRPLTPGTPIKAYSHLLGESGTSFYATPDRAEKLKPNFPNSMSKEPFLICGDNSFQKINLQAWFEEQRIAPTIVAEFDDSALMKYFGQSGHGVFSTPSIIEEHVTNQHNVEIIGKTDVIKERFYAISPERKVKHPGVKLLTDAASDLFKQQSL